MKKIKILTVTLLIILITMVSFFGVYEHVQNRMENKVKEYDLDMDLKGARYIKLSVNKENKAHRLPQPQFQWESHLESAGFWK